MKHICNDVNGNFIFVSDMIASLWLFSILSTAMLREIECLYETPVISYRQTYDNDLYQVRIFTKNCINL